jgi:hypothetical protein
VCYVVLSRDLPVVAEAPLIVAEVVIVIVAVAVFVLEVYVVCDKDHIVEGVVLLNRVTEDASGKPVAGGARLVSPTFSRLDLDDCFLFVGEGRGAVQPRPSHLTPLSQRVL